MQYVKKIFQKNLLNWNIKNEIIVSTRYVLDRIYQSEQGNVVGLAMRQAWYEILEEASHDPRNCLGDDNV